MLQQAARQRTDSHNVHRMKDLSTTTILQDVAVKGSNVADEHAPEHALNLFTYKYSLNSPGHESSEHLCFQWNREEPTGEFGVSVAHNWTKFWTKPVLQTWSWKNLLSPRDRGGGVPLRPLRVFGF